MKLMKLIAFVGIGAALAAASNATLSQDFDHLRQSVVRIQAISSSFDWFHPFSTGSDNVGLGSGWVVQTEPYPLFVTNEHVINDAKKVTLQLLLFGEEQWEAEVVSVCSKFDLALLVLKRPDQFQKAMNDQGIQLKRLPISEGAASMGEAVVALGFPLGQDSLKISMGNVAGNEDVDGNICIQSTAPISPGSSGGPLLNADATQVVGVNFAKATAGENINYVIPAWRVGQLVRKHLKDQPHFPKKQAWERIRVHVPKPQLVTIEANEALYSLAGGCREGMYISKIQERSFFKQARPHVPEQSFLVSVNGNKLDKFGMGINKKYAADKVHFPDLFFMVPDLNSDVEFEVCRNGEVTKHKTSLAWKQDYDRGIRFIDEPTIDNFQSAYEMFGDIAVMEMTVNHIGAMIKTHGDPGPSRWLHPDLIAKPRLIVNFVSSGSYAADVISVGAAVSKINGEEVNTLDEFREHFQPKNGSSVWTLETDMGNVVATMFEPSLKEQFVKASSMNLPFLLTPSVLDSARKMELFENSTLDGLGSPTRGLQLAAGGEKTASAKKHAFLSEANQVISASPTGSGTPLEVTAAGPVETSVSRGMRVTPRGSLVGPRV
eukprot:gnl/TRDRNA2_/TRDRNA2_85068_c0_seq1.p1 gnl/TRDRNA2_/TRDRNA2_85068_c0~~gnl/TRDRNA2_/TRDRNA2_85068_c0_seq1.p1  ORF type:complete len:604 (+),score=126.42 gnl/TRDRNA2_/TRDRNA2_85068_c0_seq1:170-1981(+)